MHAVCFGGSLEQEGYAQRQTLRHQGVESFVVVGETSTLCEAKVDSLQSAR